MSVAFEVEYEACGSRLYALSDHPARSAPPPPRVRRRRVVLAIVLAVAVLTLLTLLALPVPAFGGRTLAQVPPTRGQEYVVKAGDTLASIAAQVDPVRAATLTAQLARETGSAVVVPGEHLFIP